MDEKTARKYRQLGQLPSQIRVDHDRPSGHNVEWSTGRIEARQNWMATQAASIWRLAQLS
jgi:hypothetical protein